MKMSNIAIWALTPRGGALAGQLCRGTPGALCFFPEHLEINDPNAERFKKLSLAVAEQFHLFQGHVFIMAAGIVVRLIASKLGHKAKDPAVVVMDEAGRYAISLLSGHMGGANRLAEQVAAEISAIPVITTATDVNRVPAVDSLAMEKGLVIENPEAIKGINMAFLTGGRFFCHDPFDLLTEQLPTRPRMNEPFEKWIDFPGLYIDDRDIRLPHQVLKLRPKSLVAGIGCNRNTSSAELESALIDAFARYGLSIKSLFCLASVDIKADEKGILALCESLRVGVRFFNREDLQMVQGVQTPSKMAEKHIGVTSVCEAAAILGAAKGNLIVPKQISGNVTVAIARRTSLLSE